MLLVLSVLLSLSSADMPLFSISGRLSLLLVVSASASTDAYGLLAGSNPFDRPGLGWWIE
jgi:hypothetical protein